MSWNYITSILSDFSFRKQKTDMLIRNWKMNHADEYKLFLNQIEVVRIGDLSIIMKMFTLAKQCCPIEALTFYDWFIELSKGKQKKEVIAWGEQAELIAQCLEDRTLSLSVNMKTGKVGLCPSDTPNQKDCLIIRADAPSKLWKHLRSSVRAYFVDQLNIVSSKHKCDIEQTEIYHLIAFFSQIIYLAHGIFLPKFLSNLYDEVIEQENGLPYCMYYFVVFDHGLTRMASLFNDILIQNNIDNESLLLIKQCVTLLVKQSFELECEDKNTWTKTADKSEPELWAVVAQTLRNVKVNHGRKKTIRSIDELLIGNKVALKKQILLFIQENTEDICLAYLLWALVHGGCMNSTVKYMEFHRAIEALTNRKYGHDVPQKRYGEIRDFSFSGHQRGNSYRRAKELALKWKHIFCQCK